MRPSADDHPPGSSLGSDCFGVLQRVLDLGSNIAGIGSLQRGNILLQHVLKGATNATPETSKQDRRLPINTNMLKELFHDLDMAGHLDTAVFTIATMAFYGQLHLGEICSDREVYNTFNSKTLPNLSHLKPPHTPSGSHMMHMPWTKVKRATGEDVAICRQQDTTDPITALNQHLQINAIDDPGRPQL